MLTTSDVAKRVGVTPKTVARWADAGLLRHTTTAGQHRRFDEAEVTEDLAAMNNTKRKAEDPQ